MWLLLFFKNLVANPKSTRLISNRSFFLKSSKILSGLRSLYMYPLVWTFFSYRSKDWTIFRLSTLDGNPLSLINFSRLIPYLGIMKYDLTYFSTNTHPYVKIDPFFILLFALTSFAVPITSGEILMTSGSSEFWIWTTL